MAAIASASSQRRPQTQSARQQTRPCTHTPNNAPHINHHTNRPLGPSAPAGDLPGFPALKSDASPVIFRHRGLILPPRGHFCCASIPAAAARAPRERISTSSTDNQPASRHGGHSDDSEATSDAFPPSTGGIGPAAVSQTVRVRIRIHIHPTAFQSAIGDGAAAPSAFKPPEPRKKKNPHTHRLPPREAVGTAPHTHRSVGSGSWAGRGRSARPAVTDDGVAEAVAEGAGPPSALLTDVSANRDSEKTHAHVCSTMPPPRRLFGLSRTPPPYLFSRPYSDNARKDWLVTCGVLRLDWTSPKYSRPAANRNVGGRDLTE
ncbi:hypothetical protein AOLI_G00118770 [Acnodon oligacanthus]